MSAIDNFERFGIPPEDMLSYVHDMLGALANLAEKEGEFGLARAIRRASAENPPPQTGQH